MMIVKSQNKVRILKKHVFQILNLECTFSVYPNNLYKIIGSMPTCKYFTTELTLVKLVVCSHGKEPMSTFYTEMLFWK
jgi:hypothetical protein